MSALMDLVAGDAREILLAIAIDDWAAFDDRSRFAGHLALGGGLDPTWLDLFSEAVRSVVGDAGPPDFIDARRELDGPGQMTERSLEAVDRSWFAAVARLADHQLDAVAGRWIDLVEEDLGELPGDEKPWIRDLTARLVSFARAVERADDVIFAWAL
jgi:hypothetical protein